jgi:hypothetical protein
MKEYEIEVIHTPSGQYFTMTAFYNDDVDEEYVWQDISDNISINVIEV